MSANICGNICGGKYFYTFTAGELNYGKPCHAKKDFDTIESEYFHRLKSTKKSPRYLGKYQKKS